MVLVKAMIEVLDADAVDPSRGLPKIFPVQFNPTECTFSKGAQIAEIGIPGIDSPILQFVRGQAEKLTLDLFFDTTVIGGMAETAIDVRVLTRSVYQLVKMQPRTHAPPRIMFRWGLGLSFQAVVESVQQRFTLFSPLGVPLSAVLSVAFKEHKSLEEQLQELNLQSTDHTKERVVQRGDTLHSIAAREYGDPALWRALAAENPDLSDAAFDLPPGQIVTVPPLAEALKALQSEEG